MYRAVYAPPSEAKRELIPSSAFNMWQNQFQAPEKGEGFDEIKVVNFVWTGSDEQRKKWDMYMLETR